MEKGPGAHLSEVASELVQQSVAVFFTLANP